jgi:hypothetical protein
MKQMANERLLLRIDEVASLIGVSRTTAYALITKVSSRQFASVDCSASPVTLCANSSKNALLA